MIPGFNSHNLEPRVRFRVRHTPKRKRSHICLQPLQNYNRLYSPSYLIWLLTWFNRTIESTLEAITSSRLFWRQVCFNINNSDNSKVTWLVTWHVTWLDVILGSNPVPFSFWLAPEWTKFIIKSGRNLPFWRNPYQLRSDINRYVNQLQPFSSKNRSNPVQYFLSSTC